MWRAMVLDRLSQCRLEPEGRRLEPVLARNKPECSESRVCCASTRGPAKYVTKVCGARTRLQWFSVPQEPRTGCAWYPRNEEPVELGTPGYHQFLVVSLI